MNTMEENRRLVALWRDQANQLDQLAKATTFPKLRELNIEQAKRLREMADSLAQLLDRAPN